MAKEQLPDKIGRYTILDLIGSGGMGILCRAQDPHIDREIAIKCLLVQEEELRIRFVREARAAGRLQHANIVTIFDVGQDHGTPFIAMEYVPGMTLAEQIERRDALPLTRRLEQIEQLCAGLAFAHEAGVIHRDIKPANLMVHSKSGQLKILDFGIARVADSTMTQGVIGTPSYMSPEQIEGRPLDHRSDVFAVGLVIYELLVFRRAFTGDTPMVVSQSILHGAPVSLEQLAPDLDPQLIQIVDTAIQKNPDRRYQDLTRLGSDIAEVRRHLDQGRASVPRPEVDTSATTIESAKAPTPGRRSAVRQTLLRRREAQLKRHLDVAGKALEEDRLEDVQEAVEQAAMLDPDDARVVALLDRLTQLQSESEVAGWLAQAEQHLKEGELERAQEMLSRAGDRQPDATAVAALQRRVRRALVSRQRERERAEALRVALARAELALETGDLEDVLRAVSEVLAEDAQHKRALELRHTALDRVGEQELQAALDQRATEAVSRAHQLFEDGQLDQALGVLRDFTPTRAAVEDALAELTAAIDRRRETEGLVAAAAKYFAEGELVQAGEAVEAALRLEPDHVGASDLQAGVDEAAERLAREQHEAEAKRHFLAAQLDRARRDLNQGRLEEAQTILRRLERDGFSDGELGALTDEVEHAAHAQVQAAELAAAVQLAETRLGEGDFAPARQAGEAALRIDPDQGRALIGRIAAAETAARQRAAEAAEERQRRDGARRQEEIDRHLDAAREAIDAGRFSEACDVLDRLQQDEPDLAAASELLREATARQTEAEEARRRERVATLLRDAQRALEAREFSVATDRLRGALELDPENERARLDLAAVSRAEQAFEREVGALVDAGRREFDDGGHAEAVRRLESFSPSHGSVIALLEELRARRQWIEDQLAAARSAARGERFDEAVATLAAVGDREPKTPGLAGLVADVRQQQDTASTLADAKTALARGDFVRAQDRVALVLERDRENATAIALRNELDRRRRRAARVARRNQAVRDGVAVARRLFLDRRIQLGTGVLAAVVVVWASLPLLRPGVTSVEQTATSVVEPSDLTPVDTPGAAPTTTPGEPSVAPPVVAPVAPTEEPLVAAPIDTSTAAPVETPGGAPEELPGGAPEEPPVGPPEEPPVGSPEAAPVDIPAELDLQPLDDAILGGELLNATTRLNELENTGLGDPRLGEYPQLIALFEELLDAADSGRYTEAADALSTVRRDFGSPWAGGAEDLLARRALANVEDLADTQQFEDAWNELGRLEDADIGGEGSAVLRARLSGEASSYLTTVGNSDPERALELHARYSEVGIPLPTESSALEGWRMSVAESEVYSVVQDFVAAFNSENLARSPAHYRSRNTGLCVRELLGQVSHLLQSGCNHCSPPPKRRPTSTGS